MGTTYHAFLSHKHSDKPAVEEVAHRLDARGIACWLDKWHLVPGEAWQSAIAKALADCNTCVVFIGRGGFGSWQHEEMQAAIDRRVNEQSGFRVIPVLLPGARKPKELPTFLTAHTFVEFRSLDDEEALRRLIAGIRGLAPGPGVGRDADPRATPYRGLETFGEEHSRFFFGRKQLVKRVLTKLERQLDSPTQRRFLAIIGASGSGKSSLARAGVIPALKAGQLRESSAWPVLTCRPGYDPSKEIAVALASHETTRNHAQDVAAFMKAFRGDSKTLDLTVSVALHGNPEFHRLVVLLDQFEELFTLCSDEHLRQATIENLLHAASVPGGKTLVVLTMRADFYPKCASYSGLSEVLSDGQVLVGPMSNDELREVIEEPAKTVGCEVEPGLVEMLLRDMAKQSGGLPLLQHALRECWNRREGSRLNVAAYTAIGGLEGAIRQHADAAYKKLDEEEQKACQRVFLRLTQPGEGTEDTKRRVFRDDLGINPVVDRVIPKLMQARLVTICVG